MNLRRSLSDLLGGMEVPMPSDAGTYDLGVCESLLPAARKEPAESCRPVSDLLAMACWNPLPPSDVARGSGDRSILQGGAGEEP